ncbi:thiamine diphosphokinase [Fructilactobacillus fructivorans]|uniref:Thiamine diphosphokinase n=1 Tax=Fructilactobacillus fructivorans TaxID=1614 RepID=A0AAE6P0G2_9LACO|nr:thiamine diphosphokinase [Fructilactobacillus fructivorans]KRK58600.1 thiamine pyrophosphokinase [Fructilactobacillus fructivorans]KRN13507.1 thiamine pyrophosphokinase [Fructilactobacillus fructivorans]KRN40153.1 thiamine pyrophosphokinase [Fructilactobacillus fructivorans]KRN43515.1 thiamine pyrophosphokinase [Fructilactobacillus fructivorans]QFX92605.1 thiamine diphosphokinase [Fructilactobacillus fructivorans]
MNTVNVVVGGPVQFWPSNLQDNQISGPFVGVDRGSLRLIKMGIRPDYAVGDFDSVSDEEFKLISQNAKKVIRVDPVKDETDTELGVMTAGEHFASSEIDVYGFSGGRLDHLLTNLLMVLKPNIKPYLERLKLIDSQNQVRYFLPGSHQIEKINEMKYLDFCPLTAMHLTLNDERYQLNHKWVSQPTSYSSNEFIGDKASFSFDDGVLMVIQSRD